MSRDEMEALLAVPDRQTLRGRAEHALLLFLYNTGARVSEATRLQVGDLQISRHRQRAHSGPGTCQPVFLSRHRKRYTRFGVYPGAHRGPPSTADR
ncbi:tyrosine-type recombinase/integrase [Mesorhizobium sp.]|uniref:tyrosine-type recombinase/integrase n=1 Tax=Mesorhizobium sp. TaxID=1871066 RepID=UPI0025C011EE|nr:tyrosine-type recombinase/integrase [Mesorhizobium sp.]